MVKTPAHMKKKTVDLIPNPIDYTLEVPLQTSCENVGTGSLRLRMVNVAKSKKSTLSIMVFNKQNISIPTLIHEVP